jgi:hypothetical protein
MHVAYHGPAAALFEKDVVVPAEDGLGEDGGKEGDAEEVVRAGLATLNGKRRLVSEKSLRFRKAKSTLEFDVQLNEFGPVMSSFPLCDIYSARNTRIKGRHHAYPNKSPRPHDHQQHCAHAGKKRSQLDRPVQEKRFLNAAA